MDYSIDEYERNIDYIIRKGSIELVDEFTGRVAEKQ